jgi:diguanylate cyclase (GGDEF)-like protein/putative nucleotidyltransferase with HDIG domain
VKPLSIYTRGFLRLVTLIGLLAALHLLVPGKEGFSLPFFCYLAFALLSSGLKVRLPGVTGTLSVSFLFILIGLLELGLRDALLLGLCSALAQVYWHASKRPALYQVLFNLAAIAIAVTVADAGFHSVLAKVLGGSLPVKLLLATVSYFVTNTFLVACAISLTERRSVVTIWRECYFWALPYYLVNVPIVCITNWANRNLGFEFTLLAMPVAWVLFRSYQLYIGRLEAEKTHVEKMNALHIRTIETLALAIEAKDQTTHKHLRRVQHYAIAIGKEIGLTDMELHALRAASLLHDIGKLAVPEHILTKPGKLTPQEFEKMKIHPTVGAEILDQVDFPYPVVPIVRAHHEKWDGTGYPLGLAGEEIPLGARILSAVDCLDALASDRQYRRALPIDEAMAMVQSESGKSYDPRVVDILAKRYRQLDEEAARLHQPASKLSVGTQVKHGQAPATGFESPLREEQQVDFHFQIAAAGREAQNTLELVRELGNSLGLGEMLSVLSSRLTQLIPCDAIAVYELKDTCLIPVYVDGRERILLSSLRIPLGQGLSGWVAENDRPILNGNPSVELGYLNDPSKFTLLRSALSVPLAGLGGNLGVLSLYCAEADRFTADHLRILSGISSKIGLSYGNALKYRALEESATTDYLTGLNNSRALFERVNQEISRCQREHLPLTLVVCDLDHFKEVNDRFGHKAGNRVLQDFAKGLSDICREYDLAARFGGDEFVLVLPGATANTTTEKLLALSTLASEVGRRVCGENVISASFGVASWPEDGATCDELLGEADLRMYAHKGSRKRKRPTGGALAEQAVGSRFHQSAAAAPLLGAGRKSN